MIVAVPEQDLGGCPLGGGGGTHSTFFTSLVSTLEYKLGRRSMSLQSPEHISRHRPIITSAWLKTEPNDGVENDI